jgi:hypothetical protein
MKTEKFTVMNPKFSADEFTGTFQEIVENIISYNDTWGTDYKPADFRNTMRGILCRDELIAK